MKKLFLLIACAFIFVVSANAQDAKSYLDKFVEKTGLSALENTTKSVMLDMEAQVMGMAMPIKVVSSGKEEFRADMSIQGQNVLIVGNDKVAYITVAGQVQKVEDPEELKQMLPMKELSAKTFFDFDDAAVFSYEGQDGKGKNLCNVVLCKDKDANSKLFFNAETGLLQKVESEVTQEGQTQDVIVEMLDYKQFSNGALNLPSKMVTKVAGQEMIVVIKDCQFDYPTAPWMFAFPEE